MSVPSRRYGMWAVAVVAGLSGAYLAVINVGYWLWVANSAFRGLREPQDIPLGLLSVALAIGPIFAGVGTFAYRRRSGSLGLRCFISAAAAVVGASFLCMLFAALLMGPF